MIVAVLQARNSSSRLPGKVMKPLLGQPMLARQLERIARAEGIDHIVVATSDQAIDDPIVALCHDIDVHCYRGSLDDVLDRLFQAALAVKARVVMRLTGDCPLTDPSVLDDVLAFHAAGNFDYASNTLEPTFPDGLDVEVMTIDSLETAWREATTSSDREHVTPFIYGNPGRFRLGSFKQDKDLSNLRWTVDEASDFAFVEEVYQALQPANPAFTTADILQLLRRRPELAEINSGRERNEGYTKSMRADEVGTPNTQPEDQ